MAIVRKPGKTETAASAPQIDKPAVAAKAAPLAQEEAASPAACFARLGGVGLHASSRSPPSRSMRQVRIRGRPTRALGSSLSMASSSAMPRPSLLALPAQS